MTQDMLSQVVAMNDFGGLASFGDPGGQAVILKVDIRGRAGWLNGFITVAGASDFLPYYEGGLCKNRDYTGTVSIGQCYIPLSREYWARIKDLVVAITSRFKATPDIHKIEDMPSDWQPGQVLINIMLSVSGRSPYYLYRASCEPSDPKCAEVWDQYNRDFYQPFMEKYPFLPQPGSPLIDANGWVRREATASFPVIDPEQRTAPAAPPPVAPQTPPSSPPK